MENLSKSARTIYLKLCYSGLQEDMAQRIMFSILPHLADSSHVSLTQGIVDVKGLRAAAEGRKDVIKYGSEAILNELQHYGEVLNNNEYETDDASSPHHQMLSLMSGGNIVAALDIAVDAFADKDAWASRFGGRAWEMIAKTVRQIARLDKSLDALRKSGRSADAQQQEIQIMRDLVVELNIFDGLAHNSDSIMSNMIELEVAEKYGDDEDHKRFKEEYNKSHKAIKRLMDAKELDNPNEVFKQIRDTLTDSGDINKFKEWVGKMRGKQDFFQPDRNLATKLFTIHLRKAIISVRSELNDLRDRIAQSIQSLETKWDDIQFVVLMEKIDIAAGEIDITTQELRSSMKGDFLSRYPEFQDQAEILTSILQKPVLTAEKIVKSITNVMTKLQHTEVPVSEERRLAAIGYGKEALSLLNHFSYLLDGI